MERHRHHHFRPDHLADLGWCSSYCRNSFETDGGCATRTIRQFRNSSSYFPMARRETIQTLLRRQFREPEWYTSHRECDEGERTGMPHRVRASISSRSSALPHHRGYYPEDCASTVWKEYWSWHSRRQLTFPRFEMVLSEQPFPRCRCSYPKKENCDQSFPCPSHWLLSSRSGKLLLRKRSKAGWVWLHSWW